MSYTMDSLLDMILLNLHMILENILSIYRWCFVFYNYKGNS